MAILGLLCLVALWFWVPLVWGWISEEDDPANPAAARASAVASSASAALPAAEPRATANKPQSPQHDWRDLVRWMEDDPRTSATDPALGRRDPFLVPRAEAARAETEDEATDEAQQALVEATPEALGMVLSGTIVGPRRRVAQINGKPYRQGETVRLLKDGRQIEFALVAVHPRQIVLRRNAEEFELTIPVPAPKGRIELTRGHH
jgi:hypothetical protein